MHRQSSRLFEDQKSNVRRGAYGRRGRETGGRLQQMQGLQRQSALDPGLGLRMQERLPASRDRCREKWRRHGGKSR